jgi:phosphoribosylformimino-5-aminoimidazole carboxamide ribonucleotide (ProFAR) isomerase
VIASGGVAGREDISTLAALAQPDGIEGVIIGKALYAGRLSLADALALAAASLASRKEAG